MKRNFLTLLLAFVVVFSVSAQKKQLSSAPVKGNDVIGHSTSYFSSPKGALGEDFEGDDFLPMHWSQTANENEFEQSTADDWFSFSGKGAYIIMNISASGEQLITPLLDVDGSVNLEFDALDGNGSYGYGSGNIQVQYSTDGINWTDIGAAVVLDQASEQHSIIDISALSGQYYFAFNTTSTFDYSIYNSVIVIDNVVGPDVIAPNDVDLRIFSVTPSMIQHGETVYPTVSVGNAGNFDQATFTITVTITDGITEVYSSTLDVTNALASLSGQTYTMVDGFTPTDGDYTYTATVIVNSDEVPANNMVSGIITVGFAIFSGDITTCSGNFFDANGPHYDYDVMTTYTMTVYPEVDKNVMSIHFTEYAIEEDWDYLYIYDGVDVTAPEIVALTGYGSDVTFTASNDAGALTFVFISDESVTDEGWIAEFMCVPTYTVTFTVDDGADPIENAEVMIGGQTLTTDINGVASIELSNGEYNYSVSNGDLCDTYTGTVTVEDADVDVPIISLTCQSLYTVTFTVYGQDTSLPLEGASVEVTPLAKEVMTTDVNGVATFDLENGDYSYAVSMPTYDTYTGTFTVFDADVDIDQVNLVLTEGINELNANVNVYPNPSNGVFTVSVNGTYNLQVVDITGKVISTQEITNTEDINIQEAGVYMLRLTNDVETLNYKVIVK